MGGSRNLEMLIRLLYYTAWQRSITELSSSVALFIGGASMKVSHVHCCVCDLPAAARWFQQVLQVTPVVHNERMAWLGFGEFGVILDAAPADSTLTLGFDSEDCDRDYRTVTSRGAETIEAPQDRPWGTRSAYLKGPGGLTVEIEQLLKRT
jgi:predicted enzyme related to lactoylglutathione lyase